MGASKYPWLDEAGKLLGLCEIVGSQHEKQVVRFFAEAGHAGVKDDETAWCAAFQNAMLGRASYKGTGKLNARSFLTWGKEVKPQVGAIVVLQRGNSSWQGHVGTMVAHDATRVKLRGGNQGNCVNDKWFPKSDVLGYRWPTEKVPGRTTAKVVVTGGAAATIEATRQVVENGFNFGPIIAIALLTIAGATAYAYYRYKKYGKVF